MWFLTYGKWKLASQVLFCHCFCVLKREDSSAVWLSFLGFVVLAHLHGLSERSSQASHGQGAVQCLLQAAVNIASKAQLGSNPSLCIHLWTHYGHLYSSISLYGLPASLLMALCQQGSYISRERCYTNEPNARMSFEWCGRSWLSKESVAITSPFHQSIWFCTKERWYRSTFQQRCLNSTSTKLLPQLLI